MARIRLPPAAKASRKGVKEWKALQKVHSCLQVANKEVNNTIGAVTPETLLGEQATNPEASLSLQAGSICNAKATLSQPSAIITTLTSTPFC